MQGQLQPWAPLLLTGPGGSHQVPVALGAQGPSRLNANCQEAPGTLSGSPSLAGFPRSCRCQVVQPAPAGLPRGSSDRAAAQTLAWAASRAQPLLGEWGLKGSRGWQWPAGSWTGLGDYRAVARDRQQWGCRGDEGHGGFQGHPFQNQSGAFEQKPGQSDTYFSGTFCL